MLVLLDAYAPFDIDDEDVESEDDFLDCRFEMIGSRGMVFMEFATKRCSLTRS